MKIGLRIILASMFVVLIEAYLSYHNSFFWPSQVMERWGRPGIAFVAHGGMWSDLLLLPSLFAFVIKQYSASWTKKLVARMAGVGIAVATANHLLLITMQAIPDPIGWKEEWWSGTIALHFAYMSTYVALAGLFYFSANVSVRAAVSVSIVLGLHMALGTHIPLGIANRITEWPWCPDLLASPVLPFLTAGIWAMLAIFASIAAGKRAAMWVGHFGLAFTLVVILAKATSSSI